MAIGKEALTFAWAVKIFHYFPYAWHIIDRPKTLRNNHYLLNCRSQPKRITIHYLLHDFTTKYIKGKLNVLADSMSHLLSKLHMTGNDLLHISIKCITHHVRASDLQVERIFEETSKDDTLLQLKHVIHNGWPTKVQYLDPELQEYWKFHQQKTIEDGLNLRNTNIVILTLFTMRC